MTRSEVEMWELAFRPIKAMPPLKRRLTMLFGFIGIMIGVFVFDSLPTIFGYAYALLNPHFVRLACVAMVLGAGGGLFYFRRRQPVMYGASQIGFAAVTAWFALTDFAHFSSPNILQLAGAVYIVVRGIRDCAESTPATGLPASSLPLPPQGQSA